MTDALKQIIEALAGNPPLLILSLILAFVVLPFASVFAKRAEAIFERYASGKPSSLPTRRIIIAILLLHALVGFGSSLWCYFATDIPAYGFEVARHPYPRLFGWSLFAVAGVLPLAIATIHPAIGSPTLHWVALVSVVAAWIYTGIVAMSGNLPLAVPKSSFSGWNSNNFLALPGQAAVLVPSFFFVVVGTYFLTLGIWKLAGIIDNDRPPDRRPK